MTTQWVKSSYSNGNGGGCVEWQPTGAKGTVPIRDSKRGDDSPVLRVPADSWAALVNSVR